MTELRISDVTVTAGNSVVVTRATLTLRTGELVAMIGPNGAGKTSLLQAALGITKVDSGGVTLAGDDIAKLSTLDRAQRVAYLPQIRPLAWPNTVRDLVALGRFAYGGNLHRLSAEDANAVAQAIEQCGIEHLALRKAHTLSGGELALVHCARAFAANAPLIIADEPVAALDPQHQYRILHIIRDYVRRGHGALIVLHDMSLAAQFADRIVWMKGGSIEADGTPADTLTAQRLADVFGISATVTDSAVVIHGAL